MFERSLEDAVGDGYLGSAAVVEGLVRRFVARTLAMKSKQDLIDQCNEMADVMMGIDPRYKRVDDSWPAQHALLQNVCYRYNVKYEWERRVWQHVFEKIEIEILGIVKSQFREQDKIDSLIKYTTCVLMGTADAVYGKSTLWQFEFDPALEAKVVPA